jgi:hypothetical protein
MTNRPSRRCFTSPRPLRTRFTPALWVLLVTLTPLAAEPPAASANVDPSHEPAGSRGPVLSSYEVVQGAILLRFSHAEGGLTLKHAGRGAFEITGSDHVWFPAEAHLVNGAVVVSTSLVQKPVAVRYHWSTAAAAALFNSEGQPAAPISTDH